MVIDTATKKVQRRTIEQVGAILAQIKWLLFVDLTVSYYISICAIKFRKLCNKLRWVSMKINIKWGYSLTYFCGNFDLFLKFVEDGLI